MLNWIVLNRIDYFIKIDLALNNQQRLICHKTHQTKQNQQMVFMQIFFTRVSPHFIVAKELDCQFILGKFEHNLWYVHFQHKNTKMTLLFQTEDLNSIKTGLLQG